MIGLTKLVQSLEIETIEDFIEMVEIAKLDKKFEPRWPWIIILYEICFYGMDYPEAGQPFGKSKEEIHGRIKGIKRLMEKHKNGQNQGELN